MQRLRLDQRSDVAHRQSVTFLFLSITGLTSLPIALRLLGLPPMASGALLLLSVAAFARSIVLLRRVRCPHCTEPLLFRLGPTWLRTPPSSAERGVRLCAHCHAPVEMTAHSLPPSNSSLERP